jgi:SM-20-related protein
MTTKEILSGLSEALLQDERILSSRERELLSNLLQHAKANSHGGSNGAVAEVIAHTIGETVAQRAFRVLGSEILEQIGQGGFSAGERNPSLPLPLTGPRPPKDSIVMDLTQAAQMVSGPRPPKPSPTAPAPISGPRPPKPSPAIAPTSGPRPPKPSASQEWTLDNQMASRPRTSKASSNVATTKTQPATTVAVLDEEQAEFLPAQFVVLDEFLVPEELSELTQYARSREANFVMSEVIAPGEEGSITDYEHRRSRVLMDLGEHQAVIVNRIRAFLPSVLQKLGREMLDVSRVEAQMTASNDGDFFRHHNDNGQGEIASRELTFVYFFHREPKAFRGGELRLYDSRRENGEWVSTGNYHSIEPQQNQIVFFPSMLLHEITPVECPSRAFADSRFTVNGWFHR